MLESIVELLGNLFLTSLTLLIGVCIVGSIVAALWAVRLGSGTPRRSTGSSISQFRLGWPPTTSTTEGEFSEEKFKWD
jgi:hypothetical protein